MLAERVATLETSIKKRDIELRKHGFSGSDTLPSAAPAEAPIAGNPMPEPDAGSFEELRQRIHRMADVRDIGEAVTAYVKELVQPLVIGHPLSLNINGNAYAGRKAGDVQVNDWVENKDGKKMLGRVTDKDGMMRNKIRWFKDGQWQPARSPIGDFSIVVRVLFDWQAAEKYPEAFATWKSKENTAEE